MASLGEAAERDRRLARRYDEPVKRLNALVDRIAVETGHDVPYFDPDSAGEDASGLLLAQDPSAVALRTRFVSPDNPDATAASTTQLIHGLDRRLVSFWNAVPWKYAPARLSAATRDAGVLWLAEVLRLLPSLRAVIVLGEDAWHVWDRVPQSLRTPEASVQRSPHLSRRGLNRRANEAPGERLERARRAFEEFRSAVECAQRPQKRRRVPQEERRPGCRRRNGLRHPRAFGTVNADDGRCTGRGSSCGTPQLPRWITAGAP